MFIGHVDDGLEKLIRNGLPLPETFGDVAFDAPTKDWAAQLTRITVNVYLYDVSRSSQPSRSPTRPQANGGDQPHTTFRRPQPMVQLTYLVSAWAGGSRDEHQLLSDLVSLLAGHEALPPDLTAPELSSTVQLALGDETNALRELWQAIGGPLRPAVQLRATVAADTFDWEALAPAVERVQGMAKRMAEPSRG
jgi:hypothetical protein